MAIPVTNPTVIPAKTLDKARINVLQVKFYEGNGAITDMSAFVNWEIGTGEGAEFVPVTTNNCNLTAEELAEVLLTSQGITPTEQLIEGYDTPMDKIFPALVAKIKAKGLL